MLTVDAPCKLLEQRHLDLLKLGRINYIQDFLHFAQEHHFLGGIYFWPVFEETKHDLFCQGAILLQKLNDAVCKLWVIHRETLDFVKRDKNAHQEGLVLLFERQREAVDDRPQNLQEFSNAVMSFGLIDEVVEHVVDGTPDGCPEIEKLAIYPV
jgi:hypothetical protein